MNPLPNAFSYDLLSLLTHAGIFAKTILGLLLLASLMNWALFISKWRLFRKVFRQNRHFDYFFWNLKSIDEILQKSEKYPYSIPAQLFKAGLKELRQFNHPDAPSITTEKLAIIQRSLYRQMIQNSHPLESHLGWFGTTAATAPFVGLLGTVWGILTAFQTIGATGAAQLGTLAPGISEALITTAAGIGVAIPAVVFNNYFSNQLKKNENEIEIFMADFLNLIERNLSAQKKELKG